MVYKYTIVDVPSGVTITFGQHPSGAPVVWLATGNVTVNGRVNLDGEDGLQANPPIIPYYTRPGPGGFQGGQVGHPGAGSAGSFGLGPGSAPVLAPDCGSGTNGFGASHAPVPAECVGSGAGLLYGNVGVMPLLGGSGGNADDNTGGVGAGAGGGAILVAAPTQVTVGAVGSITAEGGAGPGGPGFSYAGSGSGGAIRLRAETVSLSSGSQLVGRGGTGAGFSTGGNGRVRIEAGTVNNGGTINGSQSIVNAPSVVFPAAPPPQLYVTSVCGQSAPSDPMWGINSADIDLNSASACTVNIEATGMPVGTIVVVRAIPARGSIISVNSTPMADAGGGLRTATATASVTFPAGRAELQLRANW